MKPKEVCGEEDPGQQFDVYCMRVTVDTLMEFQPMYTQILITIILL